MFGAIFNLRVYAYLRRAAVALERIADAAESLAHADRERTRQDVESSIRPKPRKLVVSEFDPEIANARWHAQEIAAGRESVDEDAEGGE